MLLLLIMIPFAEWGMILFNDELQSCNDTGPDILFKSDCVGTFVNSMGFVQQRVWDNIVVYNSFDDIGSALISMYEMIMEEGWMNKLYAGMMTDGDPLTQPRWPPLAPWNAVYFLSWMIISYVIMRNLFVGVILQAFMTRDGTALLTNEQRRWVNLQQKLSQLKPSKKRVALAASGFRKWCFDITKNKFGYFYYLILGITLTTLVMLATETQHYEYLDNGDIVAVI